MTIQAHAQSAADEQLTDEIGIPAAVSECEKISDEIDAGIKRAMPCDCRAQGSRVRCGDCGQ